MRGGSGGREGGGGKRDEEGKRVNICVGKNWC
jgi:hypothetical protein